MEDLLSKLIDQTPTIDINGQKLEVRLGEFGDLADLVELQMLGYNGLQAWSYRDFVKDWKTSRHPIYLVVTNSSGLIVAMASGRYRGISGGIHLSHLIVEPALRRLGLGEFLLDLFIRSGQKLGASRCTLEVQKSNQKALFLYQKFNFEVYAIKKNYYGPGQNGLMMVKDLEG